MATALTVPTWQNRKRNQLIEKRAELLNRISAVDEALQLLDANPEVERLADTLSEAMKSEY